MQELGRRTIRVSGASSSHSSSSASNIGVRLPALLLGTGRGRLITFFFDERRELGEVRGNETLGLSLTLREVEGVFDENGRG